MAFRVTCLACKSVAVITSSTKQTEETKELYCNCTNPFCGHTFVVTVSFARTLSPSVLYFSPETRDAIQRKTRLEQQELFHSLAG